LLIQVYVNPLEAEANRPGGFISSEDVENIFSGIREIYECHKALLPKFRWIIRKDKTHEVFSDDNEELGPLFLEITNFLKIYPKFINHFDIATQTKDRLSKNQRFLQFLQRAEARPECMKYNLDSFLILPIQRIPRYVLLIQELLKNTPEDHEDYNGLSQALKEMRSVAEFLNEEKRNAENAIQVDLISKQLIPTISLVAPHRRFLFEDDAYFNDKESTAPQFDAEQRTSAKLYSTFKGRSPVKLFLFNDCLILTNENKVRRSKLRQLLSDAGSETATTQSGPIFTASYGIRAIITLHDLEVQDVSKNQLKLVLSDNTFYLLSFSSERKKQNLQQHLLQQRKECQEKSYPVLSFDINTALSSSDPTSKALSEGNNEQQKPKKKKKKASKSKKGK